jgi:hypothetical protein
MWCISSKFQGAKWIYEKFMHSFLKKYHSEITCIYEDIMAVSWNILITISRRFKMGLRHSAMKIPALAAHIPPVTSDKDFVDKED